MPTRADSPTSANRTGLDGLANDSHQPKCARIDRSMETAPETIVPWVSSQFAQPSRVAASSEAPQSCRAAMSGWRSAHFSPTPPRTSPSIFTPVARTLFRPTPQVAAIRGPQWMTPAAHGPRPPRANRREARPARTVSPTAQAPRVVLRQAPSCAALKRALAGMNHARPRFVQPGLR